MGGRDMDRVAIDILSSDPTMTEQQGNSPFCFEDFSQVNKLAEVIGVMGSN